MAWFYTAFEYRDQVGGVLVGTPDLNADTISKHFASAPLIDAMGTVRGDWQISNQDVLTMRFSMEQLGATGVSSPDRALGSASQGQVLQNNFRTRQRRIGRSGLPEILVVRRTSYDSGWRVRLGRTTGVPACIKI